MGGAEQDRAAEVRSDRPNNAMRAPRPAHLAVSVGAGLGESFAVRLEGDGVRFEHRDPYGRGAELVVEPTSAHWRSFRRKLDKLDVWSWRPEYSNEHAATDGVSWGIEIAYNDRAVSSGGYEAFPSAESADEPVPSGSSSEFKSFCRAISGLLDGRLFGWTRSRQRTAGQTKGSQLRLREWVGNGPEDIQAALVANSESLAGFVSGDLQWHSPRAADDYREIRDDLWTAAALPRPTPQEDDFWPRRGPVWDGVATVPGIAGPGLLLVEAKSHEAEVRSSGTAAGEDSLHLISNALDETKDFLSVPPDIEWTGRYYQIANRLAFLYYLAVRRGIPTWLVFIYFLDDSFESAGKRVVGPATADEWSSSIAAAKGALRLPEKHRLSDRTIELFLHARAPVKETDIEGLISAFLERRPAQTDALGGFRTLSGDSEGDFILKWGSLPFALLRSARGETVVLVPEGLHDPESRGLRELIWNAAEDRGHRVGMDNDALARLA